MNKLILVLFMILISGGGHGSRDEQALFKENSIKLNALLKEMVYYEKL